MMDLEDLDADANYIADLHEKETGFTHTAMVDRSQSNVYDQSLVYCVDCDFEVWTLK